MVREHSLSIFRSLKFVQIYFYSPVYVQYFSLWFVWLEKNMYSVAGGNSVSYMSARSGLLMGFFFFLVSLFMSSKRY